MRRGDRESAMAEQKKDGGKGRNGEGRRGSTMSCELRRQITRHVIGEFRNEYLLAALGKHQKVYSDGMESANERTTDFYGSSLRQAGMAGGSQDRLEARNVNNILASSWREIGILAYRYRDRLKSFS